VSWALVSNARHTEIAAQVFNSLDVREATRYEYNNRIKHFLGYIDKRGPLDINILLEYKRSLAASEHYSISSKNKYLSCAKVFLRECYRLGLLPRDISSSVKCFQQDKKHKKFGLDDVDVAKVRQWLGDNPERYREQAMLCLLLFQGLRQAEICNIRRGDVHLADRTLLILGKGRDDKEAVYLHPDTINALRAYLKSSKAADIEYLFVSKRAHSANGRLTERGLRQIIKRVFDKLGIDKDVHGCRHYFTTKLIASMPGELTTVAKFTRHRSLEMLSVYNDALLMEHDVQKFYAAFST
jgi:site-specific recombinase XerD